MFPYNEIKFHRISTQLLHLIMNPQVHLHQLGFFKVQETENQNQSSSSAPLSEESTA